MGSGIAQLCLEAGISVVGHDLTATAAERGRERILGFLSRKVEKGQITAADRTDALSRLKIANHLSDLADVDVVIEAAFEDLEVKHQLFTEIERHVTGTTILATNTSALSVGAIATATVNPERVVGMHFFNPAPLMPLVEVIQAERTEARVVDEVVELAKRLGKNPIRCGDTPGFVVNRVLIPLLNDCIRVLDETGVSAEDLDKAMMLGAGWPMGPLALADMVGLDVHQNAAEALHERLREPRMAPPQRLTRLVTAGKLGRKSGSGFFRYGGS